MNRLLTASQTEPLPVFVTLLTAQTMGNQATLGNGRTVGPLPPISRLPASSLVGCRMAAWFNGHPWKRHRRHLLRESHHGPPAPQNRRYVKGVAAPLVQPRSPGQWSREDLRQCRQEGGLFTLWSRGTGTE